MEVFILLITTQPRNAFRSDDCFASKCVMPTLMSYTLLFVWSIFLVLKTSTQFTAKVTVDLELW